MPAPTPQEMFGFGSVPLTSYFKTSPGASQDTRFSPAARMLFAQQEEMQREQEAQQRKQQAEQLANQLLGQAPGMSEQQLNQELLRNPAVFGGGLEGLSRYQQFRQQVAPSQSDEVLGPAFLKKINDPRHAERFQQRMLQEGMSANDAWEAYRTDEYNDKHAIALAEAGVPGEEIEALKVNGLIDPVAAARHVAKIKQEKTLGGQPDIDRKLSRIGRVIENQRKRVEEGETGYEKNKDGTYKYPDLVALEQQYEKMAIESLLSPEEKAAARKMEEQAKAAGAVAPAAPVVEEEKTEIFPALPEQRATAKAEEDRKATIKQRIGSAWTQAKNSIEKNLLTKYSPEDLDVVAEAIVANRGAPIEAGAKLETTEFGAVPERYNEFILRNLGFDPYGVAFSEPENERLGTQDVTNKELLREWAESRKEQIDARKKAGNAVGPTGAPMAKTRSGNAWTER
jgi:hypothetical protein